MLTSLDKIDGVEASSANYAGTLLRIRVLTTTNLDQVMDRVRKTLAESGNKSSVLAGDELKNLAEKEQWRETGRIAELSAIEFRTIALHRIKTFSKHENLTPEVSNKLVSIADQQWERLAMEAVRAKNTEPEDWRERCKKSVPAFVAQAKEVLSSEQTQRLVQALANRCEDQPEAPPALSKK
jgi:hypothetical protein